MVKRKKRWIALIIMFLSFTLILIHININVNPIIVQVSNEEVKALAAVAVNNACDAVLADYMTTEMVDYVMEDGSLQLVKANISLINTISRKAIEQSQKNIKQLGETGVPIPLGSMSGIMLLSGQGPDVYIKVFPIGTITGHFKSEFVEAGINQTSHKIILTVSAGISVVVPGASQVVKTDTEIVLCENIIIGKVPDTYFNMGNNLSGNLNLIP